MKLLGDMRSKINEKEVIGKWNIGGMEFEKNKKPKKKTNVLTLSTTVTNRPSPRLRIDI